jgi:DNA-binding MarR family transcriptional regulator
MKPTHLGPAVPDLHRRVPQHLARRFWQVSSTLLSQACVECDVMPWHVALLSQLRETPGHDRTWLAFAIGVDATSTGQALDRFTAQGLVTREVSATDRRAGAYSLTAEGEAFTRDLLGRSRDVAARLLAPLSAVEADILLSLLARLVDAHEAHARPGAGRKAPVRALLVSGMPPGIDEHSEEANDDASPPLRVARPGGDLRRPSKQGANLDANPAVRTSRKP